MAHIATCCIACGGPTYTTKMDDDAGALMELEELAMRCGMLVEGQRMTRTTATKLLQWLLQVPQHLVTLSKQPDGLRVVDEVFELALREDPETITKMQELREDLLSPENIGSLVTLVGAPPASSGGVTAWCQRHIFTVGNLIAGILAWACTGHVRRFLDERVNPWTLARYGVTLTSALADNVIEPVIKFVFNIWQYFTGTPDPGWLTSTWNVVASFFSEGIAYEYATNTIIFAGAVALGFAIVQLLKLVKYGIASLLKIAWKVCKGLATGDPQYRAFAHVIAGAAMSTTFVDMHQVYEELDRQVQEDEIKPEERDLFYECISNTHNGTGEAQVAAQTIQKAQESHAIYVAAAARPNSRAASQGQGPTVQEGVPLRQRTRVPIRK